MKLVCAAIMMKNEEERITRTLDSVIKQVDYVVILDTGSTDNSIEVVRAYCKQHKMPLKLEEEPFVDFSYNRNILLKMCYGLTEFVILMDANDEIKHIKELVRYLKSVKNDKKTAIYSCRFQWENDNETRGNNHTYFKTGVIRNNIPDIHYTYPVHEFITSKTPGKWQVDNALERSKFHFYQDRFLDKSSIPRISRDIDILKNYMAEIGPDQRCLRYICQSYDVLADYDNLFDYAKQLIKFDDGKHFIEDIYRGYIWLARAASQLLMDEFVDYYEQGYAHASRLYNNAEPYYETAKCYFAKNEYEKAHKYIKLCCEIPTPKQLLKEAAVNYELYGKLRWILMYNIAKTLNIQSEVDLANENLSREGLTMISTNNSDVKMSQLNPKVREAINSLNQTKSTVPTREQLMERNKNAKLYLMTPYRNRAEHLAEFIPHMSMYLTALNIDHEILIIEQTDSTLFNKGALYNVGVKYIKETHTGNKDVYIGFHDVDIIPVKGTNYYKPLSGEIDHLYGYTFCLGGIFFVNLDDYERVNGFPNTYVGWGYEDNEFKRRSEKAGLKVNHEYFFERYNLDCFKELDEDKQAPILKMKLPQTNKNANKFKLDLDPKLDGLAQLTSCKGCVGVLSMPDHTVIKTDIEQLMKLNNIVVD